MRQHLVHPSKGAVLLLLAALAVPLVAGPAHAGQTPADDPTLASRVESRLARRGLAEGVDVYATSGRVILEGVLPTLADVRRAEALAKKVKGVGAVDNRVIPSPRLASDELLAGEANLAVVRYPTYGIFDWVWADAENGVVTLYGAVYRAANHSSLEREVADIPGVTAVINRIEILPVSAFDDQLRLQAARSIYGSLQFVQYAQRPNPPIHILVQSGKIQLLGVVTNLAEKKLAEVRVRSATLSFGVRNDLIAESQLRS